MPKKSGKFRFKEPAGCRSHNNQGNVKKSEPHYRYLLKHLWLTYSIYENNMRMAKLLHQFITQQVVHCCYPK